MLSWFQRQKKRFKKCRQRQIPVLEENGRGILIGLNYPGSHFTLRGCINDVQEGARYFEQHDYSVKILTDKNISSSYNILEALVELGKGPEKRLVFHYSGHGTQVRDLNGDEKDGYDEAVYLGPGKTVIDDDINQVVSEFSSDKVVFMIWDCCHSGTIVDLPYVYTQTSGVQQEIIKKPIKAQVIAISGCRDPQTSADVTEHFKSYGALSNTLYRLLNQNKSRTWRQLYHELLVEMKKAGYQQYPVLSASDPKLFYQTVKI